MVHSLLRQPLLHFFAIGLAIFALFAVVDESPSAPDKPTITVSQQDAQWLADQFRATWNRPPQQRELDAMVEDFIAEEIYVREALSLGLDQGDKIVRNRLRQKMEFLTESGAEAATPDDQKLRQFYEDNAEQFSTAPRVAFTQVLISQDQAGQAEQLRAALDNGRDPASVGQRTLLPLQVPPSARQAIDNTFGPGFFEALGRIDQEGWQGPVLSGYGQHLVRIDLVEHAQLPPFETMRDRVELIWRSYKAQSLRSERFATLKAQYQIERPDTEAILAR
ncbi:MAG: peptidylprolyl isomerase [Pseudomonadota bacterium]